MTKFLMQNRWRAALCGLVFTVMQAPCFAQNDERGGESTTQRNRSADIAGNIKRAGGNAAPDR